MSREESLRPSYSDTVMDKFTLPVLKHELRKRQLDSRGVKAVLVQRLGDALVEEGRNPDSYISDFNGQQSGSLPHGAGRQADNASIQQDTEVGPGDSVSQVGRNVGSTVSQGSRKSVRSSSSMRSVASMRVAEAARKAELMARASMLKEKRKLEGEELRMRQDIEDLELRTKMREADARLNAILREEASITGNETDAQSCAKPFVANTKISGQNQIRSDAVRIAGFTEGLVTDSVQGCDLYVQDQGRTGRDHIQAPSFEGQDGDDVHGDGVGVGGVHLDQQSGESALHQSHGGTGHLALQPNESALQQSRRDAGTLGPPSVDSVLQEAQQGAGHLALQSVDSGLQQSRRGSGHLVLQSGDSVLQQLHPVTGVLLSHRSTRRCSSHGRALVIWHRGQVTRRCSSHIQLLVISSHSRSTRRLSSYDEPLVISSHSRSTRRLSSYEPLVI